MVLARGETAPRYFEAVERCNEILARCALIASGVNGIVAISARTIFYVFMIH